MPKTVQVQDVRDQIWLATGSNGSGAASNSLLGTLFHEVFRELIDADSEHNLDRLLVDVDQEQASWIKHVRVETYRRLLYPRLKRHQLQLAESAEGVLTLWAAIESLNQWLCRLRWSWNQSEPRTLSDWILPEQSLRWTLSQPGWQTPVELTGRCDALVRRPDDAWCLVELKLGKSAPEADLAQGCLYHRMQLANVAPDRATGNALAMVHFAPDLRETLYSSGDLTRAQTRLIELIARMTQPASSSPPPIVLSTPAGHQGQAIPPTASTALGNGHVRSGVAAAPSSPGLTNGNAATNGNGAATVVPPTNTPPSPSPEHHEMGERIVKFIRSHNLKVQLDGAPIVGPSFLRFPLKLGQGVKVAAVIKLANELQLELKSDQPPYIGKQGGQLVVDVQRPDRQVVHFVDVLHSFPPVDLQFGSALAPIGVDVNGKVGFVDFSDSNSPHLLVAGTAGSGKSEWLIAAIAGLMHRNTPETLQFVLIDPKRNAFQWMKTSPYLRQPLVFPDETDVVEVLEELVAEMESRYVKLAGDGSIEALQRRTGERLPRIVCVCDEFYDLLAGDKVAKQDIETCIKRLGSKARAAGIHLVLATQRPSRKVIDGVIDSNLSARVGLRVTKRVDSRIIFDENGAEDLLGHGDLLFRDVGPLRRYQGLYFPPAERDAWIAQQGAPSMAASVAR